MPFLFEAIDDAAIESDTELKLVLLLEALSTAILAGESATTLSLVVSIDSIVDLYDLGFEPSVPTSVNLTFHLSLDAELSIKITSVTELPLTLGINGFFGEASDSFTEVPLNLVLEGYSPLGYENYGFFVEQSPQMFGATGMSFVELADGLLVQDTTETQMAYVIRSIARFVDQFTPLANLGGTITDSLVARDFITAVFHAQIESALVVTDLTTAELLMIGMISDNLALNDEALGNYNALVTVVSAMVLRDAVVIGLDGSIESEVAFTEEMTAKVAALVELVSTATFTDEAGVSVAMFALVEDGFALSSEPSALMAVLAELLDGFHVGVHLRIGDEVYAGYNVNTRLGAVSEYENFNFNSLAVVGGLPFGAGAAGIYRLEGDDDAGEDIDAYVRTGVLNFERPARVPNAWVGYTSSGELVLKAITMDKGRRKENWVTLKQRPSGTMAESRFDIAKGLIGMYWGFEIANKDGADFDLDMVKIWPLRLQRQYSGR